MNRIAVAALAALLPVCTFACGDGGPTALAEGQESAEPMPTSGTPSQPGQSDPAAEPDENHPPTVRIILPCDGFRIYEGRGTYFVGSASDAEDGELSYETFKWTFDGRPIPGCGEWDGSAEAGCGYGGWIESIDRGPNVLTLTATDSDGAQGSASITMTGVEFSNVSFTDDILSFMLYYCESCHGAERAAAGIRLDSYEAIMTGVDKLGRPLIVEGDPTGGILIPKILSDHLYVDGYGLHMSKWLAETTIPVWIREGARNTDHAHPPHPEPRCGGESN